MPQPYDRPATTPTAATAAATTRKVTSAVRKHGKIGNLMPLRF
jgi:hypothetical protein